MAAQAPTLRAPGHAQRADRRPDRTRSRLRGQPGHLVSHPRIQLTPRIPMRTIHILTAAALVTTGAAQAQTNAITNGDFSSGPSGLLAWVVEGDVAVVGPTRRAALTTASVLYEDDARSQRASTTTRARPRSNSAWRPTWWAWTSRSWTPLLAAAPPLRVRPSARTFCQRGRHLDRSL